MNLTEIAVRRPVTILMIVLGLVVMGTLSYGLLPVQELPHVNYPYLQVTVDDPGADPQDTRVSVTDPMENALTSVNGITSMTSVSMQGVSQINLAFASGISLGTAANDVAQALHAVARKLPTTASLPSITETNPSATPILSLSLAGKLSQTQLYELAQNTITPAIESVPGVGAVEVQGGLIPQVNVQVNESSMVAYGVTLPQIRQAILTQNTNVPSGAINNGSQTYSVNTASPYSSAAALSNVMIPVPPPKGAGALLSSVTSPTLGSNTGAVALQNPLATGSVTVPKAAGPPASARAIALGQLATITSGYAPATTMNRLNGKVALGITVSTQSSANSLSVEQGVVKVLQGLKRTLPPGASVRIIADTTVYTRAALSAVLRDLLLAVFLAAVILYVFLRRFTHTFIVLCAIPASLIATFIVMYAFGFSLDLMSMLALSLLIGILVDDSIVVLENIDRHLSLGADPKTAAIKGRMEIGAAAVAITLTDVVVYVPIVFVHGTVGQLFREFGLTVAAATLFSLFISFTLTPMLASRWLHSVRGEGSKGVISPAQPAPTGRLTVRRNAWGGAVAHFRRSMRLPTGEWLTQRLQAAYERLLHAALRHRLRIVSLAFAAFALSALFIPLGWVGTAFVPQENPQVFRIDATLPTGTSLATTDRVMRDFAGKIKRLAGIQSVFTTSGQSLANLIATNDAVVTVVRSAPGLQNAATAKGRKNKQGSSKPKKTGGGKRSRKGGLGSNGITLGSWQSTALPPIDPLVARIDALAQTVPGLQIQTDVPDPLVISGSEPVSVVVSGPGAAELQTLALYVQHELGTLPDLTNVQNLTASDLPVWTIAVNNQAAAALGVNTQVVGQAVQAAIGGVTSSTLTSSDGSTQANVVVSLQGGDHFTASQMQQIPIALHDAQMVTLGEVAAISLEPGPVALNETNRQLTAIVSAGTTNPALGTVAQQVKSALGGISLPPGYSLSLAGQIAQQTQAFTPLLQAFGLSILLVYMLMAALYESFVMPLVVLLSLPLATVGAFVGLLATGQTLNIFSLMALIMLIGLVAKNAILLVDYTGQLIRRGMARQDAIVQAGKTRLRPIVMTTATMVFSMIPLTLPGTGSADRIPIAIVLIGGLTTSTLLTLVVVPVLYTYLDDFRSWITRLRARRVPVVPDAPGVSS